ncbi:MAG TPA: hypothetical protein VJR02_07140 [Pyrinomonadaceae bacterium]|nr:hypothetical protein [Pyrinomonadaceae bacterium]
MLRLTFALMLAFVNTSATQDQPTIAKDSIQIRAFTVNSYKGNFDVWSWVPEMKFRVNGPIESGSQLYVQYSLPTGPWVKFDCDTGNVQKGYWWKTECGGRQIEEKQQPSLYTGPVTFTIKMRNELQGTDSTLFTGKMKVGKYKTNEVGPKAAQKFVYYVDHDFNLPIGYVYLTPSDVFGWKLPDFHVAFWVRGDAYKFDPHLFYQGKEVGKTFLDGMEIAKAGCEAEVEINTTHYVEESVPQKAKWARVECDFPGIKGSNTTNDDTTKSIFTLAANPGEYEFKLLWNNKLARSIKFTVQPGGKFDNGIAIANQLGSDRVIVPVTIIGDQDGVWNKTAWQTDAFYGNPLKGFTPAP